MRAQNVATLCAHAESSAVPGTRLLCSKGLLQVDLSSESHACVSYKAAWRIVQRVFSRKYK